MQALFNAPNAAVIDYMVDAVEGFLYPIAPKSRVVNRTTPPESNHKEYEFPITRREKVRDGRRWRVLMLDRGLVKKAPNLADEYIGKLSIDGKQPMAAIIDPGPGPELCPGDLLTESDDPGEPARDEYGEIWYPHWKFKKDDESEVDRADASIAKDLPRTYQRARTANGKDYINNDPKQLEARRAAWRGARGELFSSIDQRKADAEKPPGRPESPWQRPASSKEVSVYTLAPSLSFTHIPELGKWHLDLKFELVWAPLGRAGELIIGGTPHRHDPVMQACFHELFVEREQRSFNRGIPEIMRGDVDGVTDTGFRYRMHPTTDLVPGAWDNDKLSGRAKAKLERKRQRIAAADARALIKDDTERDAARYIEARDYRKVNQPLMHGVIEYSVFEKDLAEDHDAQAAAMDHATRFATWDDIRYDAYVKASRAGRIDESDMYWRVFIRNPIDPGELWDLVNAPRAMESHGNAIRRVEYRYTKDGPKVGQRAPEVKVEMVGTVASVTGRNACRLANKDFNRASPHLAITGPAEWNGLFVVYNRDGDRFVTGQASMKLGWQIGQEYEKARYQVPVEYERLDLERGPVEVRRVLVYEDRRHPMVGPRQHLVNYSTMTAEWWRWCRSKDATKRRESWEPDGSLLLRWSWSHDAWIRDDTRPHYKMVPVKPPELVLSTPPTTAPVVGLQWVRVDHVELTTQTYRPAAPAPERYPTAIHVKAGLIEESEPYWLPTTERPFNGRSATNRLPGFHLQWLDRDEAAKEAERNGRKVTPNPFTRVKTYIPMTRGPDRIPYDQYVGYRMVNRFESGPKIRPNGKAYKHLAPGDRALEVLLHLAKVRVKDPGQPKRRESREWHVYQGEIDDDLSRWQENRLHSANLVESAEDPEDDA